MEPTWNLTFSVLGSLGAYRDDERSSLDLGGPKQRLVLALLLLAEGAPLSTDRLVDEVWGDDLPNRPEASLQAYISNLRKTLEPDRAPRQAATVLVTQPAGYALAIERSQLDVSRFTDLATTGIEHQRLGRPAEAAAALAEATDRWKPLLPEFADVPSIEEAARRAETLHAEARAHLFAARLDLGESASLVADLRRAVADTPLDERLWAHLALALYRSGQQTDALRALSDARRTLADEVGVDPGPALKALEADILDQSPSLIWVPVAPVAKGPAVVATPVPTDRPLFVGRDHELDVLTSAVHQAVNGEGTAIVISGEPGIGKTRLAEELVAVAEPLGLAVAWARCPESAATGSYFAIAEIAARLAELGVIDLSDRLGFDAVDDDTDRVGVYRRTIETLRGMTGPAMIVLDDVQWGDPGTLRLVEFLAGELRNLPIALVLTTRPTAADSPEPLIDCLSELARVHGGVRLDLDGLDLEAVAAWLERRIDGVADPQLAALVHDRSGGNPFFAQELVALLAGEGRLSAPDAGRVPAAVSDVVRRRVGRLPDDSQRLLSIASVVGRTFDLDVVARVAETTLADVLDALDAPVAAGLVESDRGSPTRYRFSHALVAEALETELAPSRRARLHAATATSIATLRLATVDDHLAELAHHALAGAPAGSAPDAVRWSVRAAERAMAALAPEDAAGHYERALGVVDLAFPGHLRARLDLLQSLARAWSTAGSEERSQRVAADAIEVADQLDDVDAMVEAALALIHPTLWQPGEYRGSNDRLIAVVDRVLERLGTDGDVAARALLSGFRANLAYYASTPEELDVRSVAAVELARSTGDDEVLARVLLQRLQSTWFPTTAAQRLATVDEMLAAADRAEIDPQLRCVGGLTRLVAAYELGEYEPTDLEHTTALAQASGSPVLILEVDTFAAARLGCEGHYREALELANAAAELFHRTDRRSDHAVLFGAQILSLVDLGMLDELIAMSAEIEGSNFGDSMNEMLGFVLLEFGMPDEARDAVGPEGSVPKFPFDWLWLSSTYNAALVRAALGDVDACAALYDQLAPFAGQVATAGSIPVAGSIDLALGRMAAVLGERSAAMGHLDDAIVVERRMGSRAWLARALEAKAGLTGDPDDRQAALDLATEIGCTPVLRRLGAG